MTDDEATQIMIRLAGYWPQPAITDEEALAWRETLRGSSNITAEEAVHVIRAEAENGREWRLRPGEIVSLVLALRRRRLLAAPRVTTEDRAEVEVSTDRRSPEEWQEKINRQLAGARGPMREGVGSITQGLEVDPLRPFPESVHERGMAVARRMTAERQPREEN